MNTYILNSTLFSEMVRGGAARLFQNRTVINDLNVFPIPDGDTGDNMYMTAGSGVDFLAESGDESLGKTADRVARGMLLGARGNSGVILSRIFAGIAEGLADCQEADLSCWNHAVLCGVKQAYSAVPKPVEGTILSVYKDAAEYAGAVIAESESFEEYFDRFTAELHRSLDRTPDLLPVLKEAGVVDSGGAGFVCIAEGMKAVLSGEKTEQTEAAASTGKAVDISGFTEDSTLAFGYCTEFLLRLQKSKVDLDGFDMDAFTSHLSAVGESVVAFRDGSIVKVHVHTYRPGEILDYCQSFGEFLTLKIENMMLQHNGTTIQDRFTTTRPHKKYGTVAVASGKGIKETFTSLGVDVVVEGGQSMNPSASDFIRAFEEINADTILVFPNNGNIVLTAGQAAKLYDKAEIRVIGSKTIGEGYAALSMLDTSSNDTDAIVAESEEIIRGVVTGMVSRANRDTESDGVTVKNGDYIGFAGDVIYVDAPDKAEAALLLAEKLNTGKYDVLILLCGKDASPEEAHAIYDALSHRYPRTEIIMIDGGQPIYDFIMVLE